MLIALGLAAGLWLVWALRQVGNQPPEPGIPIDNRTNLELVIQSVADDGTELARAEIRPRTLETTEICTNRLLIARDRAGNEIARRQPTGECEETWVIETSPP